MSVSEMGSREGGEVPMLVHGPIYRWREALRTNHELLAAFNSLDQEGQDLIEWRLDLQWDINNAQLEVVDKKAHFDRLVGSRIRGELVDLSELEEAAAELNNAYQRCVEVTTEILQVESLLNRRGLPSLPYLWLTQRRDGQALIDFQEGTSNEAQSPILPHQRCNTELGKVDAL